MESGRTEAQGLEGRRAKSLEQRGREAKLPVHGFVLAGGKSSRMGVDKASLPFCGRPMVEIAVEKLRGFCAEVSIAGNRDELIEYAPVVHEERLDVGPVAGVEAGLTWAKEPWALFVPVDVPLVPERLLRAWAAATLNAGCWASYLVAGGERQPAFCMMRRECLELVRAEVEGGERRLVRLLIGLDRDEGRWLWACAAEDLQVETYAGRWFLNLNTSTELNEAESWALNNTVMLHTGSGDERS